MQLFRIAALALTLLLPLPASVSAQTRIVPDDPLCDDQFRGDRAIHCEVRELSLGRPSGTLAVDAAPNGGIEVVAWQQPNVLVRARVVARADTEDAARALANQVEIHTESDRIEADGPERSSRRDEGWWVSYELSVPSDLDLRLRSLNGGLTVTGMQSALDLRTTNGGIHLEAVGGDVRGRTTNGSLHVRLDGNSWNGAGLDLQTTNGTVDLEIPGDYAARLETGTVNGGWDIDYPIVVQGRIGRRLTADLGGGGPPIRAITTNGGVHIGQR